MERIWYALRTGFRFDAARRWHHEEVLSQVAVQPGERPLPMPETAQRPQVKVDLIAIGASTGGPSEASVAGGVTVSVGSVAGGAPVAVGSVEVVD